MKSMTKIILLVISSSACEVPLFADKDRSISIRVEASDFYKSKDNNLCFVFTGHNIDERIENASAHPCREGNRVYNSFAGSRAWKNFQFITDKFGHTWISEINLTSEFMLDLFSTAAYYSVLRGRNLTFKASASKTAFSISGLGETHTLSYAEPFKVDIDWSGGFSHRPITFRITDYQASFVLKLKQTQIFEADAEGIPRAVIQQ